MLPNAPTSCKVSTPGPLADAIILRLGTGPRLSWLEPCVGSGIFIEKLKDKGVSNRRITAIDLDRHPHPNDKYAATIRGRDFLRWYSQTTLRVDRILANPPFLRIKNLPPILRTSALQVKGPQGEDLTIGSNCWYAFLCACLKLLKPKGSLGFVLPAAWDYADYATPLRTHIQASFRQVEVHRSYTPIFADVKDGAVVLFGEGFHEPPQQAKRFEYETAEKLIANLCRASCFKPTKYFQIQFEPNHPECRLGDIATIRIGTVTGDSRFFLLNEEQRIANALPVYSLKPVISKACHLISSELNRTRWEKLRKNGKRIWLFCPADTARGHKAVSTYLRLPAIRGGCNRSASKVKSRNPWYRPQIHPKCDGFMSGMSTAGPWICFSSMPHLCATNTLYVVTFKNNIPRSEKYAWALSLLTSSARKSLRSNCRIYAVGLRKYEPSDLSEIILPKPLNARTARKCYRQAVEALLRNDESQAISIADKFFDLAH